MINITKQSSSFLVESDELIFPSGKKRIEFPFNSVALVIDESDMAVFKSASNFDVIFASLYSGLTIEGTSVTKDNIVDLFATVATSSGGEALKDDIEGLTTKVDDLERNSASYVTTNTNQTISSTKTFTGGTNANPALVAKNGMQVGGDDVTSVAQFQARRSCNNKAVKGTFFVNGDGRIKYNRTVDGVENAAMLVDDTALKVAFGKSMNTEYEVLHEGNTKTINGESILGSGEITVQGGSNVVSLTQAEYEALEEKDQNVMYNITDAQDIEVYTKTEIDNKIGDIETLLSKI